MLTVGGKMRRCGCSNTQNAEVDADEKVILILTTQKTFLHILQVVTPRLNILTQAYPQLKGKVGVIIFLSTWKNTLVPGHKRVTSKAAIAVNNECVKLNLITQVKQSNVTDRPLSSPGTPEMYLLDSSITTPQA